jgi:hypothetical protein
MFSRESFLLVVCALVGALLGAHPLYDPDLGWNLVGGFYLIDNLRFPYLDPIAEPAARWINYGWLPQLLFAFTERVAGLHGLLALQIFLSSVLFVAGVSLCSGSPYRAGAMMLFLAPICHLRPQLLSVICFMLFLHWRESRRDLKWLLPLCVVWANTHVYWIFAPAVLWAEWVVLRCPWSACASTRGARELSRTPDSAGNHHSPDELESDSLSQQLRAQEWRASGKARSTLQFALLASFAGVLSPYTYENLQVVIEYAFFHSFATPLIREFQSLYQVKGYLFPLAGGVFVWLLLYSGKPVFDRIVGAGLYLLSLSQMKFAPLFGVMSLGKSGPPRIGLFPLLMPVTAALIIPLFLSPLRESERELIHLAHTLRGEKIVGNLFDEGGWLSYALYGSNSRIIIDGRTLVMGRERLRNYAATMKGERSVCEHLARADVAILRREGRAYKRLKQERCPFQIGDEREGTFVILKRSRLTS